MIPDWVSKYTRLQFEDFDCWQLVRKIYEEQFKITLPSYKLDYKGPRDSKNIALLTVCESKLTWDTLPSSNSMLLGNLILFNIYGIPCHIGLCVDPKKSLMIHTMDKMNVVIEKYTLPRWSNRIVGCFCYVG